MNKPTLIRVASDLHIESQYGRSIEAIASQFLPFDKRDSQSILVLAGDISSSIQQLFEFLVLVEQRFFAVVYIPGNHEFYHQDMDDWQSQINLKFKSLKKTHWSSLGVESISIGGVLFIFGTLWGDGGPPQFLMQVQYGLADFSLMTKKNHKFSVYDMIEINKSHASEINELLSNSIDDKIVVVTHHLPSYSLCHPRFGVSISGGFASACDSIIISGKPNLWIHGHTHDTGDSNLYGTRVVCNPYGYSHENNSWYNSYENKFIEIEFL